MKRSRTNLIAALCLAPSAVLFIGVIFYPILRTLYASLCEVDKKAQPVRFGTLENFRAIFTSKVFMGDIIPQTLIWTGTVVVGTLIIAMFVAMALNEQLPGRRFMRATVLLPWATSLVITAAIFKWLLHPTQGPINGLLEAWGAMATPPAWLARPDLAFASVIAVGIWVSIPFTSTVLLAGLQAIPDELYEAAVIDGASRWQRNVIHVFNSFPLIWTLTEGGPANQTHIIVTYLYRTAIWQREYGQGYAMAVVTFLFLLIFAVAYTHFFAREEVEQL